MRDQKMAQLLRTLVALPGDLGSGPAAHMMAPNHLQLQFEGI